MKKYIVLLLVFIGTLINAQFTVEEVDDTEFLSENGKSLFSANVNFPMEHFRISGCNNVDYAKPVNAEEAFKLELFNNMLNFVDKDSYALNGTFYFVFEINPQGEISNFELKPNVVNGNMFYEDMKFAVKRLKTKWFPANCGGSPISSKVRMKVNFKTDVFDL